MSLLKEMYFKYFENKYGECIPCFGLQYLHYVKVVLLLLMCCQYKQRDGEEFHHWGPEHLDQHHFQEE